MRSRWSALSRSSWATDTVLSLGFALLSLSVFLFYGTPDQEEYQLGVFSSLARFRALWAGHWPYWFWDYGFGTPLPLGHSFDSHPFFLASPFVPFALLYGFTILVHLWAGTFFLIRFLGTVQVEPGVARVAGFCFSISTPILNFVYTDDWPSCLIGYTLVPVLLFLIRAVIDAPDRRSLYLASILLGIAGGFFLVKGHAGHTSVLGVSLAVYAVMVAGRSRAVWLGMSGAAIIALLMASETIFFLRTEMQSFPAGLERILQEPLVPKDYVSALIKPIWPGFSRHLSHFDWREGYRGYMAINGETRTIFIGLTFGLCTLASVLLLGRPTLPGGKRNLVATLMALAVSAGLSLVDPKTSGGFASAGYLFRDNVVIFSILAASLVLTALGRAGWTRLVAACLLVQACQATLSAVPALIKPIRAGSHGMFPQAGRPTALSERLMSSAERYGNRIYFGPEAFRALRGRMSGEGIYGVTDLALAGLAPVNGWFKNVSMDDIAPSPRLMHGMINPDARVISDQPLLDFAGINLVLLSSEDVKTVGPAPGLTKVDAWTSPSGVEFQLFANKEAWPRAILLAREASTELANLPRREGCDLPGLMCADLSRAGSLRLSDPVAIQIEGDTASFTFPAASEQRVLMASVVERPEWKAWVASKPVEPAPVADAFLGITVSPGATDAKVRFDPMSRRILFAVSLATTLVSLTAAAWLALLARRQTKAL